MKREKRLIRHLLAPLLVLLALLNQASCRPAAAASDPNRPVNDKWALVVGISQFKDPSMNLKFPAKDARDFAEFLVNSEKFAPDHVKLLLDRNATRENLLDTMGDKWLPRVSGPDDLVLIYISTHGSASAFDVGGVNYLLAYDTDKDRMYSTGIAMQDLTRIIKGRIQSDRMVIILDACHSGAVSDSGQKGLVRQGNFDAADVALGTGQLVICSSDTNQISWESKHYPNSVFTRGLIAALQLEGARTKLSTAFTALKDTVSTEVRRDRGAQQTPVLKGKWQGDELVIAVPPLHPGKGIDTAGTLAELNSPSATDGRNPDLKEGISARPTTAVAIARNDTGRSSPGFEGSPPTAPLSPAPTTGQPKPEPVATSAGVTSTLSRPALVAVMPFGGPEHVKSDAGLVFAIKNKGFHRPRETELNDVPEALREAVTQELRKRFGQVILGPKEMADLKARAGTGSLRTAALGQSADYVLDCSVHNVEFNGDELFGSKWLIEFSFQLVSAASKKVVASMNEHGSEGRISSSSDPLKAIYEDAVNKVAATIVDKISARLTRLDGSR
jgi:hypothetical protein